MQHVSLPYDLETKQLEKIMETLIVHFKDRKTRDIAVQKAIAKGIKVFLVGEAGLVNDKAEVLPYHPFIAFSGSVIDGVIFMQNGATSCGSI